MTLAVVDLEDVVDCVVVADTVCVLEVVVDAVMVVERVLERDAVVDAVAVRVAWTVIELDTEVLGERLDDTDAVTVLEARPDTDELGVR